MNRIVGHGFWGVMAWLLVLSIGLPEDTNTALAAGSPDTVESLQLPVPRSFDLAHVKPEHFAVALGKDPQRIFAFVRDQIAYEVYEGYLRGPRGTLLALAGNSVDQAALLGSLLEHAGQRVRYLRGELSEAEAKKLVDSMWAERPRPAPAESELTPEVETALETLRTGVERDYNLIRDHLKRIGHVPGPEAVTSRNSLVKEAQVHYWVQWWSSDGLWIDMDPSMAESSIGETFAPAGTPFEAFPEELFHRVEIRIRLEEYTGDQPSSRVILKQAVKAAELSGIDVVLSHQPEKWKGPARSVADAMSAAIEDTGRVKPVFVIGNEEWKAGDSFRQKPPTQTGVAGVMNLLSGAGTRESVPIATAEWIEFDFIYPGGHKETVVREIFDIVGKARRENGQTLSEDEVRSRAAGAEAFDVTSAVYDLFFSTGRLDTEIVSKVVELSDLAEGSQEIDGFLQRVNIAFVFTSDGILGQLEQRRNASVRSYPDSPRVQIAALSVRAESERLSLDLRRRDRRAVMMSPQAETAYYTRVFQGVLDGTLERVLVNYVAAGAPNREQVSDTASTSVVFENAKTAGVPIVLLTGGNGRIPDGLPEDTLARMREDVSRGYLVIAPQGPVDVDGTPGLAWWRIDPRSGETTAITSDGLHAATTEYMIVKDRNAIHIIVKQTGVPSWTGYQFYEFHSLYGALRFINGLIAAGATMFALP